MLVKSPCTAMPVLGGVVAGDTVTVNRVLPPGSTEVGLAEPEADSAPPPEQELAFELLRGIGPPTLKSILLLSVSWQPFCFLIAAVVFERMAVGEVSEQSAVGA